MIKKEDIKKDLFVDAAFKVIREFKNYCGTREQKKTLHGDPNAGIPRSYKTPLKRLHEAATSLEALDAQQRLVWSEDCTSGIRFT